MSREFLLQNKHVFQQDEVGHTENLHTHIYSCKLMICLKDGKMQQCIFIRDQQRAA